MTEHAANAAISDEFARIALADVIVVRDARQRRTVYDDNGTFINSDGLLESIAKRGILNPLIVTRDLTLVAGERRLEAARLAGHATVPIRFLEDMPDTERQIIELEENLRRAELPWRDEVLAVADLHALYKAQDPAWTMADTERATGYSQVHIVLRVAQDIDDPKIVGAAGIRAAYNVLARRDERATANAVNDIIDAGAALFRPSPDAMGGDPTGAASPSTDDAGPAAKGDAAPAPPPPESILNCDFIEWADAYSGPSFNFIHCDFPYGIGVFAGKLSGRDTQQTYDDSADVYERLIAALCRNLDKLMSHSAHLMFWCSADIAIQYRTVEMFARLAPSLAFHPKPLVWHKTDNVGIIANPKEDPRHVYETALIASRESRQIIRSVSDAYGAPTDKSHHPSTKPEPVLRHFFSMFCDEHSRVLDPTCGSGSSLRAAESLGASFVLGIERDAAHAEAAASALRTFRTLRKVTR